MCALPIHADDEAATLQEARKAVLDDQFCIYAHPILMQRTLLPESYPAELPSTIAGRSYPHFPGPAGNRVVPDTQRDQHRGSVLKTGWPELARQIVFCDLGRDCPSGGTISGCAALEHMTARRRAAVSIVWAGEVPRVLLRGPQPCQSLRPAPQ